MLTVVTLVLSLGPAAGPPPADLSGRWAIAAAELDGQPVPLELVRHCALDLDAAAGTFRRRIGVALVSGYTDRGTFAVVGAGPAGLRVDLSFTRAGGRDPGPSRESRETARELWRLDGRDRLAVCLSDNGRPDRVGTEPGDGRTVLVFVRERPDGQAGGPPAAGFDGVWTEAARETGGERSTALAATWPAAVVVRGAAFAFSESSLAHSLTETGTFAVAAVRDGFLEVDVTATQRLVTDPGKETTRRITRKELWWRTAAGEFRRCFPADPGAARPAGFKTAPGDGLVLLTLTPLKAGGEPAVAAPAARVATALAQPPTPVPPAPERVEEDGRTVLVFEYGKTAGEVAVGSLRYKLWPLHGSNERTFEVGYEVTNTGSDTVRTRDALNLPDGWKAVAEDDTGRKFRGT